MRIIRIATFVFVLVLVVVISWNYLDKKNNGEWFTAKVYNVVSVKPLNGPTLYGIYYTDPKGNNFMIKSDTPASVGSLIKVRVGKTQTLVRPIQ